MDLGSRQFWVQIFKPCIFQLKLLTFSSLKFPHVQIKDDTNRKKKRSKSDCVVLLLFQLEVLTDVLYVREVRSNGAT